MDGLNKETSNNRRAAVTVVYVYAYKIPKDVPLPDYVAFYKDQMKYRIKRWA